MSLRIREFTVGDIRGTIFTFEKAGDVIPIHSHTDRNPHVTIVARGKVRMHGPEVGDQELSAGTVIDNDKDVTHGFVALEDNSRIVHILTKIP